MHGASGSCTKGDQFEKKVSNRQNVHFFLIDVDFWLFLNNTNNNRNPLSLGLMKVVQIKRIMRPAHCLAVTSTRPPTELFSF